MYQLNIYSKRYDEKNYKKEEFVDNDKERVLESLTYSLMNRYVWKGSVQTIKDRNNYDGTRTIDVFFRVGSTRYKYEYIVEL